MPYTILNRPDASVIEAQPKAHEFGQTDPEGVVISFYGREGVRLERMYDLCYSDREVSEPVHGKHYFLTRLIIPDDHLTEHLPADSGLLRYVYQFPQAVFATEPLFMIAKGRPLEFSLTILRAGDPDRTTLTAMSIGFTTSDLVAGAHKVSFTPV